MNYLTPITTDQLPFGIKKGRLQNLLYEFEHSPNDAAIVDWKTLGHKHVQSCQSAITEAIRRSGYDLNTIRRNGVLYIYKKREE